MPPLLEFHRVSKSFWRGTREIPVLDEVSWSLDLGEAVAVLGEAAAGKTTLLRIAAGLIEPDRGRVVLNGQAYDAGKRSPRIQGIGADVGYMRATGPAIRSLRIIDYVALPLFLTHRHVRAKRMAEAALKRVGVQDLANARWSELSDAERTRVAIAHATIRSPRLLIADDPTAGMRLRERDEVVALLRSIADEREMAILTSAATVPVGLGVTRSLAISDGEVLMSTRPPNEAPGEVIRFPPREGAAS
jgi:ABC-type multidrug transport system ATPase subunit